jgi:CheY-like chemotaxis protein
VSKQLQSNHRLDDLRILLVEDDNDSREVTALLLSMRGASVSAAESAEEAVELLVEASPDVLVSDIGLPRRDGCWLARYIQKRPIKIPAIALSALTQPDDIRRALRSGFSKYLGKPMNIEILTDAILNVVSAKRPELFA